MLTWSWIIQITIISFILIFLIHHLLNFFKSVLTVPKIKDLVNRPKQKYNDIYNVISSSETVTYNNNSSSFNNDTINYNLEDILPSYKAEPNMKTELKNFIKKQLNNDLETTIDNSTNIQSLQSTMEDNFSFIK
jgi:hypothetical protein